MIALAHICDDDQALCSRVLDPVDPPCVDGTCTRCVRIAADRDKHLGACHGTPAGYVALACRCPWCQVAWVDGCARYRAPGYAATLRAAS